MPRVQWGSGAISIGPLRSDRAARVRAAPIRGEARFAEETLLIEWPKGEDAPTKYWLTTVDPDMPLRRLVDLAKMRWRVERDYEDLNRKLASAIMRAAAGRASIITAHLQSQPMVS